MQYSENQFENFLCSRNDEVDNLVYQLMRKLLQLPPEAADNDPFPWDMSIIGNVKDAIEEILGKHGYEFCHPYYAEDEGGADEDDPKVYVFTIDQAVSGILRVPAKGRSEDEVFADVLKDLRNADSLDDLPGFTQDEESEIEVQLEDVEEYEPVSEVPDGGCNTRVNYTYRDADNYKVHNTCVVKGAMTEDQRLAILDSLHEGEFFIPGKVGLDGEQFSDYDPEVDHPWFELGEYSFELTDSKPNTGMTVTELTERFVQNKGKWEE